MNILIISLVIYTYGFVTTFLGFGLSLRMLSSDKHFLDKDIAKSGVLLAIFWPLFVPIMFVATCLVFLVKNEMEL